MVQDSSPTELLSYIGSLTPQKAIGGQMSNFVKENKENLFDCIEKLLAVISFTLNVKNNLKASQLAPLAREIYSKYYFYSIDELSLVLSKGSQGDFGSLMHKFDKETIFDWFRQYEEMREPYVENARQQAEKKDKVDSDKFWSSPEAKEFLRKTKEKLESVETSEQKYQRMREEYFSNKSNK